MAVQGVYRKKPVTVEAAQWDGSRESLGAICRWVNSCPEVVNEDEEPSGDPTMDFLTEGDEIRDVQIYTLEGPLRVSPGDWIIKGVKGEFYPCKPDVFDATYESFPLQAPEAIGG